MVSPPATSRITWAGAACLSVISSVFSRFTVSRRRYGEPCNTLLGHSHKKARLKVGLFLTRLKPILDRSFSAGFVLTGTGVDFDPVVDVAEVSDFDLGAVAQLGWLHPLAGSVAAGGTFGVGDLANDGGRQVNRNHFAFEEYCFADVGHAIDDVRHYAFQIVFVQLVLVELLVNKDVVRLAVVRVGHVYAIKDHRLHFVVGFVNSFSRRAAQQVLQLHFNDGAVTTGLGEFGLLDQPRLAVNQGHTVGLHFLCGFHTNIRVWMELQNSWPRIIANLGKTSPAPRQDQPEKHVADTTVRRAPAARARVAAADSSFL